MHGTENTGDVRSLTDAELDNGGGALKYEASFAFAERASGPTRRLSK
jgi:hypothetical protein